MSNTGWSSRHALCWLHGDGIWRNAALHLPAGYFARWAYIRSGDRHSERNSYEQRNFSDIDPGYRFKYTKADVHIFLQYHYYSVSKHYGAMSDAPWGSGNSIFWLHSVSGRWNTALYIHEHVTAWSHVRPSDGRSERNAHLQRESTNLNPSDRLGRGHLAADSYL
jgi:hypothetical protein